MLQKLRHYPGQPKEEITQFVFFKSIFALLPFVFAAIIIGAVSLYGIYFGSSGQTISDIPLDSSIYLLVATVIFFGNFLVLLAAIWVWRHNRLVVTNLHVVDIDQIGLFNNKVATLSLGVIQDVASSINGPLQTLFHYGTLIVQTAGERENFSFDYLSDPHAVEQKILDIHKKYSHDVGVHRRNGLGVVAVQPENPPTDSPEPPNPLI